MEDNRLSRLMSALSVLGLDENWAISVVAFCGMENAIRKKLETIGSDPGKREFKEAADALVGGLKERGENPPDILMSLAKAYPEVRGRIVHWGYRNPLYETECNSIVTNTVDLVRTLFELMPAKGQTNGLAEALLELEDGQLAQKAQQLGSSEKKDIIPLILERFSLIEWQQPDYWKRKEKIAKTVRILFKSLKTGDMISLLDGMIRRFASAASEIVMGVIGDVCGISAVVSFLKDKGYISWIVSQFTKSFSYDAASANAAVIAKIGHVLSDSQIREVFDAMANNDQIRDSWGAQRELADFITLYRGKVGEGPLKKS